MLLTVSPSFNHPYGVADACEESVTEPVSYVERGPLFDASQGVVRLRRAR